MSFMESFLLFFSIAMILFNAFLVLKLIRKRRENPKSENFSIAIKEKEKNPKVAQKIECYLSNECKLEFHRVLDSQLQSFCLENYIQVASLPAGEPRMQTGWESGIASAGLQIGVQKWVASGLYKATASPSQLMMYLDGTFSSMLVGANGQIVNHSGFKLAGSAIIAPAVIFQMLSFVTGQYYLHGITKQLNAINAKLDHLLKLHAAERKAKLFQAEKSIRKLVSIQHPNVEDLLQLKLVETTIGNLHEEYAWLLSECNPEKLQKIESWLTSSRVEELTEKIEQEKIFENLQHAILTDELLHVLPLVEILMNARMAQDREQRARRIGELVAQIRGWEERDFYRSRFPNTPAQHFLDLATRKAKWILDNASINRQKVENLLKKLEIQKQELLQMVSQKSTSIEIRDQLLAQLEKPREVIYIAQPDGSAAVLVKA